jgi:hypothetical protein
MKNLLFSLLFFQFSFNGLSQNLPSNGFYSINYNSDHLVFIDTLGSMTDIGYLGRNINSKTVGLTYHNGMIFMSTTDTLFQINPNTAFVTPMFKTVIASSNNGISGSISFDNNGQLYLFKEETGFTQGKLYQVNFLNGICNPVSSNTSGNASILSIANVGTSLFGVSELDDKLLKINKNTGIVQYLYPASINMGFTNGIANVNGKLWGMDITNESTSTITKFHDIDTINGSSNLRFTLNEIYTGLAYGALNICYDYVTVTDTLIINVGINGLNPVTYHNTVKVFPNPTNDYITIDYGNYTSLSGYQLIIENSVGQQMFQTAINQQSSYISLATWTGNGLYFVHLIDPQGNTIDIRKIVLQ